MEIFVIIILGFFLSIPTLYLINRLIKNPYLEAALSIIISGMKDSFRGYGIFMPKRKYPLDLYHWQTMDDDEVCEDCLERSHWPPMDIADWMKEGLPRTPEAETKCGKDCRCDLVRIMRNSGTPA